MSRGRCVLRNFMNYKANKLYAYMTTLDNFSSRGERNKITSSTKYDRKDKSLKSSSSNQPNDENIKPTGSRPIRMITRVNSSASIAGK